MRDYGLGLAESLIFVNCSPRVAAGVLLSLVVGDLLHLWYFMPFFAAFGVLDGPTVFGVGEALGIFMCRCCWLATRGRRALEWVDSRKQPTWGWRLISVLHALAVGGNAVGIMRKPLDFLDRFLPSSSSSLESHPVTCLLVNCHGYMMLVLAALEISVVAMRGSKRAFGGLFLALFIGEAFQLAFLLQHLARSPGRLGAQAPWALVIEAKMLVAIALRVCWLVGHRDIVRATVEDVMAEVSEIFGDVEQHRAKGP